MSTIRFLGTADKVAQVHTGSIDSVDGTPANNTFTVTIGGVAISQVGTTDVATTAAALVALLNASTHPYFAAVTWTNPSSGNIVGTADVAGVPFVATLSKTGAGTGAVTDFAVTTANAGPNVLSAANCSGGALPGNGDTFIIERPIPIYWSLDALSAVTLAELRIMNTAGRIGLNENVFTKSITDAGSEVVDTTKTEYRTTQLTVGATLCNVNGSVAPSTIVGADRTLINLGSVQSAITVFTSPGTGADGGLQPVRIKGTHASNTLDVRGGNVGIATTNGSETATVVTTSSYGGGVTLSPSVTYTNVTAHTGGVVNLNGVGSSAAITSVGGLINVTAASGTVNEINAYTGGQVNTFGGFATTNMAAIGGTINTQAGNIGTAAAANGGVIDMSHTAKAFTVTNWSITNNGQHITSPLVTYSNDLIVATTGNVSARITQTTL